MSKESNEKTFAFNQGMSVWPYCNNTSIILEPKDFRGYLGKMEIKTVSQETNDFNRVECQKLNQEVQAIWRVYLVLICQEISV